MQDDIMKIWENVSIGVSPQDQKEISPGGTIADILGHFYTIEDTWVFSSEKRAS